MANPSGNKIPLNNKVTISLTALIELTVVLPINVVFAEIINDNLTDIFFAVGDRIAVDNDETRKITSAMQGVIIRSYEGQLQPIAFKEISFIAAVNCTIHFMNLSSYSLI